MLTPLQKIAADFRDTVFEYLRRDGGSETWDASRLFGAASQVASYPREGFSIRIDGKVWTASVVVPSPKGGEVGPFEYEAIVVTFMNTNMFGIYPPYPKVRLTLLEGGGAFIGPEEP